jgi:hypothetical protein
MVFFSYFPENMNLILEKKMNKEAMYMLSEERIKYS